MSHKQSAAPSAKQCPPIPVAYSKQFKQEDIVYTATVTRLENNNSK